MEEDDDTNHNNNNQNDDNDEDLRNEILEDAMMEDVDDDEDDEDDDNEDDEDSVTMDTAPTPSSEPDAAVTRRRAIQEIMRDTTLTAQAKALRIQQLMSGGRTSVAPAPAPTLPTGAGGGSGTPCVHYERNCNIVAPCCDQVYGCRICHDELSPANHPPLDRYSIREIVCKNCHTRQPARNNNRCIQCATVFGEYHCGTCNLWMSTVRVECFCCVCV